MNRTKLDPRALQGALTELNASTGSPWGLVEGKLHKEFEFADFVEAFGFMAKAALVAQAMDHHPEWCNVYKRVRVDLTTHDVGGVTELDFALAGRMEDLAG